ncbi:hypothetical protein [Ornithinimicrobium faecis]|uniref:Uncharacterized protein n=1 Tax=Ornithinimicrobium faecis TaxID=2934158 RepID=A0ABY4YYD2_9MICO|nr:MULTISPECIES: hypothetical protein [unclassified Ornithinimicrobium]USQ81348.1 hypothetical protein NF556_06790 [Ornithinimicrobium sp. HY1793]
MNEDIRELLTRGASDAADTDLVTGVWQQAHRHRRNRNLGIGSLAAAGVALVIGITQIDGGAQEPILPAGNTTSQTAPGPTATAPPPGPSLDNCGNPQEPPTELGESDFGAHLLTEDPGQKVTVAIDIANVQDVPTSVQIDINGQSALTVRVPTTASDCYLTTIFRYGLEVPPGPAQITATTDGGHRDQLTLEVSEDTTWVVVQVQDGFPLELETYDHPPGWG